MYTPQMPAGCGDREAERDDLLRQIFVDTNGNPIGTRYELPPYYLPPDLDKPIRRYVQYNHYNPKELPADWAEACARHPIIAQLALDTVMWVKAVSGSLNALTSEIPSDRYSVGLCTANPRRDYRPRFPTFPPELWGPFSADKFSEAGLINMCDLFDYCRQLRTRHSRITQPIDQNSASFRADLNPADLAAAFATTAALVAAYSDYVGCLAVCIATLIRRHQFLVAAPPQLREELVGLIPKLRHVIDAYVEQEIGDQWPADNWAKRVAAITKLIQEAPHA